MTKGNPGGMGNTQAAVPQPARESLFDIAQQRLRTILQAANSLLTEGYTILYLHADAQCVKPIIYVMSEPRLWALAAADQAVYFLHGLDECGHYRDGQFDRNGAIVRWRERGH